MEIGSALFRSFFFRLRRSISPRFPRDPSQGFAVSNGISQLVTECFLAITEFLLRKVDRGLEFKRINVPSVSLKLRLAHEQWASDCRTSEFLIRLF